MAIFSFIGGGQMAQALAQGAVRANILREKDLTFVETNASTREKLHQCFPASTVVESAVSAIESGQNIVLAVKPNVLKVIATELSGGITDQHLIISIAAGISLANLQRMLGTRRVVRVMPNTSALVGAAASAISADPDASEADLQVVNELMNAVGSTVRVPDHLMHAVTGVSGSGPAYVYLMIEALSDGGVAMGLPRDVATKLAAQTLVGAARMVLETGLHPGQLKDQVTSPGGTTIAALRELEAAGVRSGLIEAVVRCAERSEELS